MFSGRVIAKHLDVKDRLSLIFAIPNHPWVDEKDGAAVRIAMTVAAPGKLVGQHLTVTDERSAPDHITFAERAGQISSDLRIGADVTAAVALKANHGLCSPGVKLHGDGFILTAAEVEKISPNSLKVLDYIPQSALYNSQQLSIRSGTSDEKEVVFAYRNGRDLAACSSSICSAYPKRKCGSAIPLSIST